VTPTDITTMQWQPALVRLTSIGNPDVAGGAPQPAYVNASAITGIRRVIGSYATYASLEAQARPLAMHPGVECTEVECCHFRILVTETPHEVARRRDEAFGHVRLEGAISNLVPIAGEK